MAHFDPLHYLLQAPELADRDVDLIEHYVTEGEDGGLTPHPDFSAVEYRLRHPRKGRGPGERSAFHYWLKQGRDGGDNADPAPRIGRLAQVLGQQPAETVAAVVDRRRDLRERLRTGRLGEMFADAAELDPLIGEAWTATTSPKLLPLTHAGVVDEMRLLHQAQQAAGFRTARLVIVLNRGRWGGGRRLEGHIVHALQDRVPPDEVVVIHTDESGQTPPGRFPDGVRIVDFSELTRGVPREAVLHALVMLLRTFRADAIVNINSKALHHAMRPYGKALAVSERIFPVFFCHEQSPTGVWRGWGLRHFYRTFDVVAGVITDSRALREEFISRHQIPARRQGDLHALAAPVDPTIAVSSAPPEQPGRRPQVFWSGRWDRQKRIELLLEIAGLMPDVDFRMWGEPVMGGDVAVLPPNVVPQGRYDHFSQLPLDEADAWLYTSGWDGVPSLLLEVSMTGIPLVGTRVGGTEEVLRDGLSHPVALAAGAADYVAGLRSVLDDPAAARTRALALREDLVEHRSASQFAAQVAAVLFPSAEPRDDGGR